MTQHATSRAPSPADSARTAKDGGPVLEFATFRLADGTDAAAFIDAAQASEAMLRARGALIRRFLTVDDEGLWTDVVEWTTQAAALESAEEVMAEPSFQPFMAMIDPETVAMRHAAIRWRMD